MQSPWKKDFPVFNSPEYQALRYLDSSATCLVPEQVINAQCQYLSSHFANSHRGFYQLSHTATSIVEAARDKVAKFIGANRDEIAFTASATTSIHLVANGYVKQKTEQAQQYCNDYR